GEGAVGVAALAAEEAVDDTRHGKDLAQRVGRAHAKPAGLRPGLWAQKALNSVPICSGEVRRSMARAMLGASAGLARARALARSPRPGRMRKSPWLASGAVARPAALAALRRVEKLTCAEMSAPPGSSSGSAKACDLTACRVSPVWVRS